jgi:hypothetical protein
VTDIPASLRGNDKDNVHNTKIVDKHWYLSHSVSLFPVLCSFLSLQMNPFVTTTLIKSFHCNRLYVYIYGWENTVLLKQFQL